MGNVFQDITEDGNAWNPDRIPVPIMPGEHEWSLPNLWVQCSEQGAEGFFESSESERTPHRLHPEELRARHSSSDASSPLPLVFEQVVFRAGSSVGGHSRPRAYVPLSACEDLHSQVLLTAKMIEDLWWYLPISAQISRSWKLVYCPAIHGFSLRTFYRQCAANPGPTLVAMRDSEGVVFGGFTSHAWHEMSLSHVGESDCFVFTYGLPESRRWSVQLESSPSTKLGVSISSKSQVLTVSPEGHLATWNCTHPSQAVFAGDQILEVNGERDPSKMRQELGRHQALDVLMLREAKSDVQVSTWAGEDRYFMHSDMDGFAMGGGKGRAFCVDKGLMRGTSAACSTFGTCSPLAASEDFLLQHLEVWTFDNFLQEDISTQQCNDKDGQAHRDYTKRVSLRREAVDALRFEGFRC